MQKLQDSVFSIVKTTNLSPAVFSYLQPTEDFTDKTPLGGILSDTKHGWLALGPKFCVVDLRTGLKVAARTFGESLSNYRTTVTSVVELPTPLTDNSQQLLISLECEDIAGMICIFHINGSQVLRCIQTEVVVTELAVCDRIPDGPFTCYDGVVMAGTKSGEIFVFDLNRASLIQALKDISQGYEQMVLSEENAAKMTFLPVKAINQIEAQRDLAVENEDHIAVLLNENSLINGQYMFCNPDGSVQMKAKRDHIRVTVLQYIPQLGSVAVGFNFGGFQIWNLMNLVLEYTSQVNLDSLPVTHFGFQEPCDDPRAFCYLWVVFSVIDRFDEEEFPLAMLYSLTYQGKRMLSDTNCLYQDFLTATVRFQVVLSTTEEDTQLIGGRCISCHTYSVNSTLGGEGEDSMLNMCQLVWECWSENGNASAQYGMLLFDLDQWYKDQMPATYPLQSNAFMSATCCSELARGDCVTLDVRLAPASVSVYSAATRLEEHFYPNSLHYNCICLNTSESFVLNTIGIQRQIINSMDEIGPTTLLNPTRLYNACVETGLTPLYLDTCRTANQEEQRRYLLSVALEARLSRFLKRCAHDWATGTHAGAGCTLTFLIDWCWQRAIELKENARELTAPLFISSALPDRNVVRCLEHCVQQLTQLTGLLDAVLTKCCNLVVPDALSEMEEKFKGIGTVSLYFQVVQWFLRCGLLPERSDACNALPYPGTNLTNTYSKRRLKLHRLQDHGIGDDNAAKKSCQLLYIDQLIEQEFGGERTHQIWMRGGSENNGLYPPPSLYSLLRLYLLPDIAEEHKHSLVLYLLVDYSMVYDEVRYEAVIRRLMQFPTMFGLSNTAIKATQAFWHLDHRDFDFALDQLQCLTGNTLSEWQHNVVLSSLLAQKKIQAALQYLHVRKPAPIQNIKDDMNSSNNRVNDHDKLEDWQSCCNLYLARGLVFEALDVIRMCVQNCGSLEDKAHVMNFFFKGCRNTAHLSKILQVSLLPFEEEVFIKYLENCNESQTSDILIMYYLQQARYFEAEQYNNKLKHSKPRTKDLSASVESLVDVMDRESARDTLVEFVCSSLPAIANTVAHCALEKEFEAHVIAPKPMSVFVQAKSPKNVFTYKSSFIQDTIGHASETWVNRPKLRRGLKRALNIEETPFICTPKLIRNKSIYTDQTIESTPPKRPRLDLTVTPKTPAMGNYKCERVSKQIAMLLDMPDVHSPDMKIYERSGAETPHSILKIKREDALSNREAPSPVDSRYLGESEDEMMETASNHTHYSDSTNKHLRFTIPTASESGSTPSPPSATPAQDNTSSQDMGQSWSSLKEKTVDMYMGSYATTQSHSMDEPHLLESPPKKLATAENVLGRKPYKDSVRARLSLSISANSSLTDDPNTSTESIADIPITLFNPRYSGGMRRRSTEMKDVTSTQEESGEVHKLAEPGEETEDAEEREVARSSHMSITPRARRSIRAGGESTPLMNRSRSATPERQDSPIQPALPFRMTRSRSRSNTPEISPRSSPLDPIPEQPKQEVESEPHPVKTTLSVPRQLRSRSRTPERIEKVLESPRLEAITESPTKSSESPSSSPTRRSLRSRSRTPEIEITAAAPRPGSPRSLRSRSRTPEIEITAATPRPGSSRSLRPRAKTPEKLMSPKKDPLKSAKKSLTRIVLEANAFSKAKQNLEKLETQSEVVENPESIIECTPLKSLKPVSSLMDVTISPIASKSILQSSNDSVLTESVKEFKTDESTAENKSLPAFTFNETRFGKSVLNSVESTIIETSFAAEDKVVKETEPPSKDLKALPSFTLSQCFENSVLQSYQSSTAEVSSIQDISENLKESNKVETKPSTASTTLNVTDFDKSVLGSYESSAVEASQDDFESNDPKEVVRIESNNDKIKDSEEAGTNISTYKEISSLMTDDSDVRDVDMKEETKIQSENAATMIQKEMEKIVEIEREINEIEGDMSDVETYLSDNEDDEEENDVVADWNSENEGVEDEEIGEGEEIEEGEEMGEGEEIGEDEEEISEEEESDETGTESSDEATSSEAEEVISIKDTDSDSDSNKLHIDEPIKGAHSVPANDKNEPPAADKLPEYTNEACFDIVAVGIDIEIEGVENTLAADSVHNEDMAIESTTDPFNQAQISMMTDDNSMREVDHSDINLNYSDERNTEDKAGGIVNKDMFICSDKVEVDDKNPSDEAKPSCKVKASEENKDEDNDKNKDKTQTSNVAELDDEMKGSDKNKNSYEIKGKENEGEVPMKTDENEYISVGSVLTVVLPYELSNKAKEIKPQEDTPNSMDADVVDTHLPMDTVSSVEKDLGSLTKDQSNVLKASDEKDVPTTEEEKAKLQDEARVTKKREKPGPRSRKRVQSTSSNKSVKESGTQEINTPLTRKQSQSNKTTESEKTPENDNSEVSTPTSRRRATTTQEVRGVLTRRASRELSNLDDSLASVDESVLHTPTRRSTRSRSKNADDDSSIASGSTMRSTRSRASEDTGESKLPQVRKGKKSVLATKPDLSVIPETTAEESGSKVELADEVLNEYSRARRLTRHQKAVLESLLETKSTTPQKTATPRASIPTNQSPDDDDSSPNSGTFDVEPIDRISLMNKGDFEGSPDPSEVQSASPESIASDASKQRQLSRKARAASENKTQISPKLARLRRRTSVDAALAATSPATVSSPLRARRVSFNRACEALHTPKSRRTSTETRKGDTESQHSSPSCESEALSTPSRRSRRTSLTSNTSATKSTSKRSKKTSVVEEK